MKKLILIAGIALGIVAAGNSAEAKTKTVKNVEQAAKVYVSTANSSAKKSTGKTTLNLVVNGKASRAKLQNAVVKVHLKNVSKNTQKAFKDEVLCPNWSKLSIKKSGNKTVIKVVFDNKKMKKASSYGKNNAVEVLEKKVNKDLAGFKKVFGKLGQRELGAFAVMWADKNVNGDPYAEKDGAGNTTGVCTRVNANNGHNQGCMSYSLARAKVMRMIGVKNFGFTQGNNHRWNWWKDEAGTVYFGDYDNKGFVSVSNEFSNELWDIGGKSVIKLSEVEAVEFYGYNDKSDEEWEESDSYRVWEENGYCVSVDEYLEKFPVTLKTTTMAQFKKIVKSDKDEYEEYVTKGYKYTLSKYDF